MTPEELSWPAFPAAQSCRAQENDRTIQFESMTIESPHLMLLREMEGITLFMNGLIATVDRCSVAQFIDGGDGQRTLEFEGGPTTVRIVFASRRQSST